MHLTDAQLLELDDSTEYHLIQCEQCQQRLTQLTELRLLLKALPIIPQAQNNWQAIRKLHQSRQHQQQLQQSNKKLAFWRVGSLALAASLAIVILWPASQLQWGTDSPVDKQLAILIEQNNLLQLQLYQKQNSKAVVNVSLSHLQLKLNQIDQALQRAYLEQATDQDKTELWTLRKQLIKQLLADIQQPKSIII